MSLTTLWYLIVTWMVAVYVLLDGFDLGAGMLSPLITRDRGERRQLIHSLGPARDGNEAWLIAAAGMVYLAFPRMASAASSGLFVPLMWVVWMLTLRALAVELLRQQERPFGKPAWVWAFVLTSAGLAFSFGAAMGNIVRGLDFEGSGLKPEAVVPGSPLVQALGIMDWYTILCGATAMAVLAVHGATWLNLKHQGPMQQRAARLAKWLWLPAAGLCVALTMGTLRVQNLVVGSILLEPWGLLFPLLAMLGFGLSLYGLFRRRETLAFAGSSLFIVGMLAAAAFGIFDSPLPARHGGFGLTLENAGAPQGTLISTLVWWALGTVVAGGYFYRLYSRMPRKIAQD
jgi:cytochrome d ubiquinol oxidase subunit II